MSNASLTQGELIAERYHITRLIGSGGMGEVYEAYDVLTKEEVALKTLRSDLAHRDSIVRHFQTEIQLARKVTHPNVCRIFEVGVRPMDSSRPRLLFFVMELLKGGTLSSMLRWGKLKRAEAFPIAVQLAEGLEAAHRAGVMHLDFKSGNIILVPEQRGIRAVITDFGLARLDPSRVSSDDTDTQSQDMRIAGTVANMSPEQMTGGAITSASDIYSFGIVLYEMATGSLPFNDRHLLQSAMQRGDSQSISVRSKVPDIDPRWEAAIARCLQKDPSHRFKSAGEIANWFKEGAWRNPQYWTRREWIRNSAATVIALAAGTEGWILWHQPYKPLREAQDWFLLGVDALHAMNYETARKRLLIAVEKDPRFVLAHASLARAYDELDYTEKAKDSILKADQLAREIRLSGEDRRRLDAIHFAVVGEYQRAAPIYKSIYEDARGTDRSSAALESGWLAQRMEDTEAAAAAYELAQKLDPSNAAAKLRLAYIYGRAVKDELALGLFSEAEKLYRAKSDPEGVTETLFQRASLLNRRSRLKEALSAIEDALVEVPRDSPYQEIRLQLLESMVYGKKGDTERATRLAQAAKERADALNMARLATSGFIDLGNIYIVKNEFAAAEPILLEALERAQNGKWASREARARLSLGSLYEQTHRPQQAKQIVLDARDFYNKSGYRRESVQSVIILGNVFRQLGEFDEGIQILNDALPRASELKDPRSEAQLRERLALNLRDRGDWLRALDSYSQAANIYRSNGVSPVEVLVGMAGLQWRLGRPVESQVTIKEAQEFEAKNSDRAELPLINALKAEIAYAKGDSEASLAFSMSLPEKQGTEELRTQLSLLRCLLSIRSGRVSNGRNSAIGLIEEIEKNSLMGDAASARLSIAEALAAAGDHVSSLKFAGEALHFFAPKKILESSFRAHVVAARMSPLHSSESVSHLESARAALAQLGSVWAPADVARYQARPDILRLTMGLHL